MKKQQSYKRISNVDQHETTTSSNTNTDNTVSKVTPSPTSTSTPSSPIQQSSLPSSVHSSTTQNNPASSSSSSSLSIQQKLSNKLHALFFIYLSYTTIKYTNTITIIFTSNDIIRPLLYFAIVLLTINTILFLYLGIYLPKIKGLDVNKLYQNMNLNNNNGGGVLMKTNSELWSVYCPRVIPIMTFNGLICSCVLIRCFWPVWGFLTPFVLGIEFFGLLFVSHFIPWC